MISSFASPERKPFWVRSSAAPSLFLQRKCDCAAAACSCGRTQQRRPGLISHNFGEISVHADSRAGLAGRLSETANADTGCDVSTGETAITLHDPSPCYKDCTQRHEEVHRKDIGPCCKKANRAWESAKTENDKNNVHDKMENWVRENEYLLQCRAYRESVKCADEFLNAHCRGKQAEGSDTTAPPAATEARKDETEDPAMNRGPASETATNSGVAALSEDKPDEKPIDPQRCCYTVKDYWRHAGWRRDAYCKDAKPGLTPCPF